MPTGDFLLPALLNQKEGSDKEMNDETLDFNRLVRLVDETGLIRLGLILMERVAQAEGRVLWH